jgi:hypothetical protein
VPGSGGGCTPIENAVQNDAESQYLRDNVTVSICLAPGDSGFAYTDGAPYPPAGSGEPNGRLKATVTLPGYQVLPHILGFFGITKTLEADATMYQEQAYPGTAFGGNYHAKVCT